MTAKINIGGVKLSTAEAMKAVAELQVVIDRARQSNASVYAKSNVHNVVGKQQELKTGLSTAFQQRESKRQIGYESYKKVTSKDYAGASLNTVNSDKWIAGANKIKAAMEEVSIKNERVLDGLNLLENQYNTEVPKAAKAAADIQIAAAKRTEEELKKTNKDIREHFETGFSMHILQIYAAPAIRAVNRALKQTIAVFAEFDKVYTDFIVKSEEFGRVMARTELYTLAVGQAFSATNLAQAGERFAASGIDVSKSADAMIKSLELATIANIGFDESANVVIKTMQAYHLPMSEASRITDTMVNVANASTAELKDLSDWFGYAANSAYLAGVDIEEFATILGVLSSTGMKNVGPATRQIFAQFQKEKVREGFRGKFGLASDESFSDMNAVIQQLRQYVQSSEDIKKVSRDVAVTIGGKVAAQTALTNLLTAEASLWESVSSASMKAGTTTELYNKITDNAWHSIERIKNSIQLITIQFGEMFAPILKYISAGLEIITKVLIAIPDTIKSTLGAAVLLVAAAFGALVTGALALAGALSIGSGATELLKRQIISMNSATHAQTYSLKVLIQTVFKYNAALLQTSLTTRSKTAVDVQATGAANMYGAAMTRAKYAASGLMGVMIGFGMQSAATAKHMFQEARLVNVLTSLWIGYHVAKFGGPAAPFLAAGAVAASLTFGQTQISNAEREYRIQRNTGTGQMASSSIYIQNVNLQDVHNTESFMNEFATLNGSNVRVYSV